MTAGRFTIRWDVAMGCYRVSTPEFHGPLEVVPAKDYDRLRLAFELASDSGTSAVADCDCGSCKVTRLQMRGHWLTAADSR